MNPSFNLINSSSINTLRKDSFKSNLKVKNEITMEFGQEQNQKENLDISNSNFTFNIS